MLASAEDLACRLKMVTQRATPTWCARASKHQQLINGTIYLLYYIGERTSAEHGNEHSYCAIKSGCAYDIILGTSALEQINPSLTTRVAR